MVLFNSYFLLIFVSLPSPIISIFTNDENIISMAVPYLMFTGIIIFPKSLNVTIGNGIRAYGDTKWMLYTQLLGSVFVILSAYILSNIFPMKIWIIYLTLLMDESLRCIVNGVHFYRKKHPT
ncbi:MAG: MATE family efflux transporter [Spirochaetales bacterium]|nr:MATE family efflux transporter [Spirochaetales bacterium]